MTRIVPMACALTLAAASCVLAAAGDAEAQREPDVVRDGPAMVRDDDGRIVRWHSPTPVGGQPTVVEIVPSDEDPRVPQSVTIEGQEYRSGDETSVFVAPDGSVSIQQWSRLADGGAEPSLRFDLYVSPNGRQSTSHYEEINIEAAFRDPGDPANDQRLRRLEQRLRDTGVLQGTMLRVWHSYTNIHPDGSVFTHSTQRDSLARGAVISETIHTIDANGDERRQRVTAWVQSGNGRSTAVGPVELLGNVLNPAGAAPVGRRAVAVQAPGGGAAAAARIAGGAAGPFGGPVGQMIQRIFGGGG